MRGVWIDNGTLSLRDDLDPPTPRKGSSIVRVLSAGVCATDLALARGYMNFSGVPGHEFVGIAEDGPHAGQRVVGEINAACGSCRRCRRGDSGHCAERSVLGILNHQGAFAERISLPDVNLHLVPPQVSDAAATFAEPLAAAFEIPTQVQLHSGMKALVVGDGKLGLLCAHVLALHGCSVTVAGRHPERQELLPERAHFRGDMFNADTRGPAKSEARYPIIVEATGHADVVAKTFDWIEPRGSLVLKTTSEQPTTLDLARLVVDEISLIGSRCGPFSAALDALAAGRVPVEKLVESTYSLDQAAEAIRHAGSGGVLKVLIQPGSN